MNLIHEALARAHCSELLRQAEAERPAVRLLQAQRQRRRAERAERRAQQALQAARFAEARAH